MEDEYWEMDAKASDTWEEYSNKMLIGRMKLSRRERKRQCIEQLVNDIFVYYYELFPFDLIHEWITYGYEPEALCRREFSFIVKTGAFVRYQSYNDIKELHRGVSCEKPFKLFLGAMYNLDASENRNPEFVFVEKELVFDIDLTDYDEIRNCCQKAKVCCKCWRYMAIACKIIDTALREDFGFQHLLWVFSGRRGIHCWVCDYSARVSDIEIRSSIADYIQLVTGGVKMARKVNIVDHNVHHSIQRALCILKEYFRTVCIKEQDFLGSAGRLTKFLNIFEDEDKGELRERLFRFRKSSDRWNAFKDYIRELEIAKDLKEVYKHIEDEIIIQYLYPRLDVSVTKSVNHLLRCPFSIHSDTRKICVPFDPDEVDRFNPETVPTLDQILREVSNVKEAIANSNRNSMERGKLMNESKGIDISGASCLSPTPVLDRKNTSLCESIIVFEKFLSKLHQSCEAETATLPYNPLKS